MMATPYFVADSANVTVMRTLASTAFGSYKLTPPEGIEVGDIYELSAPGNELGYVATLDSGRRVGGLARRFVRADVAVTARDETNPDWVPSSTVDETLQDAAQRVSSDFFLESDISKAGLGPWVPLVDFRVGDRAHVDVWGQVISLPVTRIEPVVSERDVVDWKVHLGGQLVADEDARLAENEALQKAFMKDRRELEGISSTVSKVSKVATSAATGVKDLNVLMAGPDATSNDVLDGMAQLAQEMEERGEEVPDSLIKAFIYTSNLQWQTQQQVNAVTEAALEAHGAAIEANQQALRSLSKAVAGFIFVPDANGTYADERISVTRSSTNVTVTALGRWRGKLAFSGSKSEIEGGPSVVIAGGMVPASNGSRVTTFSSYDESIVHYSVNPGVLQENVVPGPAFKELGDGGWETLMTWTVPRDCTVMLIADWDWVAKTFGGNYYSRILINGSDKTDSRYSSPAPLFGDGKRHSQVSTSWVEVPAGAQVTVQGQAQHHNGYNRQVSQISLKVISVEDN